MDGNVLEAKLLVSREPPLTGDQFVISGDDDWIDQSVTANGFGQLVNADQFAALAVFAVN